VFEPCNLDRVDHVVRPPQNFQTISGRFDGPVLARQLDQTLGDLPRKVEPHGIDIDEGKHTPIETHDRKNVRDDLPCKDSAAGPNHRHLRHRARSL